jgi:hypothetical protein
MVFLSLRAAWLRRQRAKKALTNAKNNAKIANATYNKVKKANAVAAPRSVARNYGPMRMVRVKNGNFIDNIGIPNSARAQFNRNYKYNGSIGAYVRR